MGYVQTNILLDIKMPRKSLGIAKARLILRDELPSDATISRLRA